MPLSSESSPVLDRLRAAVELTKQAAAGILSHYGRPDLAVERKRDRSPVTAADRGAEEFLSRALREAFPGDGVLGEEFGEVASTNGFRWILDPVDGTKSFVHGVPLFGTLVGLEQNGAVVAGVCRIPALDEVVYAAVGHGAWWQIKEGEPRAARVSSVSTLEQSVLCFTEVEGYLQIGRMDAFDQLCRRAHMVRGWGDCYGHILVATGRAEVIADPITNAWDVAALYPILKEAGGSCTNWDGSSNIHGGSGVSVNAALRDEVLAILRKP